MNCVWKPASYVKCCFKLQSHIRGNVLPSYCRTFCTTREQFRPENTELDRNETRIIKTNCPQYIANTISDMYKYGLSEDGMENKNGAVVKPKIQFPPTFNFAAYANDSPTLQELLKLGVNLYKWEKKSGIPEFVLRLDFDRDMKSYIRFLHDVGVPADSLGWFLTKNPLIFKENLDDLQVRLNYMEYKMFTPDDIRCIVTKNPYWLMFSTKRIDERLGHFQKAFSLFGKEVRQLAVKMPSLITYNMEHIKTSTFVIKEELGFENSEIKELLLEKPKLWKINSVSLKNRCEFVHLEMKIPHERIVKDPTILLHRLFRIKQRHAFLVALGRAQYDPKSEGYVSLGKLVDGTNLEFCKNVAKTSIDTFNMFMKTL